MGTSGARTLSYYSRFRLSFHSNFKKSFRTLHISSGYDALHIRANSPFFKISEEIREALHAKRPIIALETAIYTHGFPYPDNIKLSTHLESVVRQQGGIPATIGVLDGIAHIGMIAEDLHKLTSSAGASSTIKVSRRDLSYICGLGIVGRKMHGGTTVAGTAILAYLAGIKVFATGGLGGVHRGAESSMDVSADLTELGRTPIAIVSSGCKSFLDIPRTLEYLETEGVTVATFSDGRGDLVDFPAFWTRDSGVQSPMTLQSEKEAAALIYARSTLSIHSGLLFANPIPEQYSVPKADMDLVIATAIREAEQDGATGKDNTPYILAKIKSLTEGKSISANRALIEANVIRGTRVAIELAKLEQAVIKAPSREMNTFGASNLGAQMSRAHEERIPRPSDGVDIIVAGSLAIDLACDYQHHGSSSMDGPEMATSNPSIILQAFGGVGHNVATAAHLFGGTVRLCSVVADDQAGKAALEFLVSKGMDTSGVKTQGVGTGLRTARYVAINDAKKDLVLAMADMGILEQSSMPFVQTWRAELTRARPKWLAVDANWDPITLRKWITEACKGGARIAFEPVSLAKSSRLFSDPVLNLELLGVFPSHHIEVATPNAQELVGLHEAARRGEYFDRQDWWNVINSMGIPNGGARDRMITLCGRDMVDQGIPQQSIQLLPFSRCVLTKLGPRGVLQVELLASEDSRLNSPITERYILSRSPQGNTGIGGIYMRLHPPAELVADVDIASVNGVGDTFLGILIAGLASEEGTNIEDWVGVAQKGSIMTLKSNEAVHPELGLLRPPA